MFVFVFNYILPFVAATAAASAPVRTENALRRLCSVWSPVRIATVQQTNRHTPHAHTNNYQINSRCIMCVPAESLRMRRCESTFSTYPKFPVCPLCECACCRVRVRRPTAQVNPSHSTAHAVHTVTQSVTLQSPGL